MPTRTPSSPEPSLRYETTRLTGERPAAGGVLIRARGGSSVGGLGTNAAQRVHLRSDAPQHDVDRVLVRSAQPGSKPITITTVELVDAQGFTLTKAQFGPILHHGPNSYVQGVVPAWDFHSAFVQEALSRAIPAIGATIKPHQTFNLLLYLSAPQSKGRMSPPKVTCTEDGKSKAWRGGQILTVVPGSKCGKATL